MNNDVIKKLSILLADTYALYLKTQNYHWHVKGLQFKSLHELFETQYMQLADAVDLIAERILTLGHKAPASFREFINLMSLKEGDSSKDAGHMVEELAADHFTLIRDLNKSLKLAQEGNDEGTVNLLGDRILEHEKNRWMLQSSLV